MKKILVIMLTLLLCSFSLAFADCVEVTWDPNTEVDLAGYRIFIHPEGQAYDYNNPTWEGTETLVGFDLGYNETYYLVCRAYDTEGLESGDSNELVYIAGNPPWVGTPPGAPGISIQQVPCD